MKAMKMMIKVIMKNGEEEEQEEGSISMSHFSQKMNGRLSDQKKVKEPVDISFAERKQVLRSRRGI